jgi:hypothetical protein
MSSRPSVVPIAATRLSIARVSCVGVRLALWPGAGQARDQPVGGLGVTAEGNDDARTRFREQACDRGTRAFAAACHQRNPSVEYAHDRSPLGLVPMAKCALRRTCLDG